MERIRIQQDDDDGSTHVLPSCYRAFLFIPLSLSCGDVASRLFCFFLNGLDARDRDFFFLFFLLFQRRY